MKAAKHLGDLNISLGQARAFIQSNLNTPDFLLQVLNEYEFSNEMLAEIMGTARGHIVRYFAKNGIDSTILDKFHTDENEDEDSDDDNGAVELIVNSNLDADIGEAKESDLYSVELVAGRDYSFTVTSDELERPYLVLQDDEGQRLASDIKVGDDEVATFDFSATQSGTFYLNFSDVIDASTGNYNIAFVVIDDFSADIDSTGVITVDGDSASGDLEVGGDKDWFAVTLSTDETYNIFVDSTALSVPHLAVYDATGTLVTELALDDEDGILAFAAETDGLYFVEVSDIDSIADGSYLVGVQLQEEAIV